jgi:hypothetical protein
MKKLDRFSHPLRFCLSTWVPLEMGTMNNTGDAIALERASQLAKDMLVNIESALWGKPEVVMQTVICVIARGHLLIEDVPGVARRRWRGQPLSRSMPISIGFSSPVIYCPAISPASPFRKSPTDGPLRILCQCHGGSRAIDRLPGSTRKRFCRGKAE